MEREAKVCVDASNGDPLSLCNDAKFISFFFFFSNCSFVWGKNQKKEANLVSKFVAHQSISTHQNIFFCCNGSSLCHLSGRLG